MNYLRYALIGLAAVALIAFIVAAFYAVFYFREKGIATQQQNSEAAQQASLLEPIISLDTLSCDFVRDGKTQFYAVTVRTPSVNINNRQQQVEDAITSLEGAVTSTSQVRIYDRDAGYINSANITGTVSLERSVAFISKIKSSVTPPDSLENENNYTQDSAAIKQSCQTSLDYLKNLRSTEMLYLSQLNSDQPTSPPFSLSTSPIIAKNLMEVRQSASAYKNTIESLMNQLNKTNITVIVKEIAG